MAARQPAPEEISELARQRAEARSAQDWAAADDLRTRIEAAGWKVIDAGTRFSLVPARPPDLPDDGRVLYGSAASVPSRLDDPPDRAASVVLDISGDASGDAPEGPAAVRSSLAGLREHAIASTQVILVADGLATDRAALLSLVAEACGVGPTETGPLEAVAELPSDPGGRALDVEILWTSGPLGPGAALEAGARRSRGHIVIVMAPGTLPTGDVISPLDAALEDPDVGVAGLDGLHSTDMRRFVPGGPGLVTAFGGGCLAFRRQDVLERGPLDQRLGLAPSVAIWWSLALRDQGPDREPRRGLALELPMRSVDHVATDGERDGATGRMARRDRYRIADRFAERLELSTVPDA